MEWIEAHPEVAVEHCRLETHPSFFDYFVEGCQFKAVEQESKLATDEHG